MEDAVEPVELERVLRKVDAGDRKIAGVLLLQRRVVVVREGVPADGIVAAFQKRAEELGADEPGCAGDEVAHGWGMLGKRQDRPERAASVRGEADLGEVARHRYPLGEVA